MPFTFFAPSTPAASASDLDSLLGAANNITHFPALGAGDNVSVSYTHLTLPTTPYV